MNLPSVHAAALLIATAFPGPWLQEPGQGRPPAAEGSAREELARASALKQASRYARGRARLDLRQRAVEAYDAVREGFPRDRQAGAEAAFRAGELLRSDGQREAAAARFEIARELGAKTDFRARAGLELGHMARRQGLAKEALEAYQRVRADADGPQHFRDDATLWAGRASADLGRLDEAQQLFERVALLAEDPVDRVRGYDELALAWIALGDLEAAAGELVRCRAGLDDTALEETPQGERVRNALERMRAVERLREEVARRRGGLVIER